MSTKQFTDLQAEKVPFLHVQCMEGPPAPAGRPAEVRTRGLPWKAQPCSYSGGTDNRAPEAVEGSLNYMQTHAGTRSRHTQALL